MEATLEEIARYIDGCKTAAVSGHVNADGDSIGSVLALTCCLRSLGIAVTPLLADDATVPDRYAGFEGYGDFVFSGRYEATPDVFISVDTSTEERMGYSLPVMRRSPKSVSIDHHKDSAISADLTHVEADVASACMLIWELAKVLCGAPSAAVASACYAGTLTDTGMFQFQNCDARCMQAVGEFVDAGANPYEIATDVYQSKTIGLIKLEGRVADRLALTPRGTIAYSWVAKADFDELGVTKSESEGLVDIVRSAKGIEIGILMRDEGGIIRCNIRSKKHLDVSTIAKRFGGGGHVAASGFSLRGELAELLPRIVDVLVEIEDQIASGAYGSDFDTRGLAGA